MQSIVLEFDNLRALEEAMAHVWDKLAVTGEVSSHPRPEGKFRLEIVSEKPIRGSTLEKVGGRIVED